MNRIALFILSPLWLVLLAVPTALVTQAMYFQHFSVEFPQFVNSPFVDWIAIQFLILIFMPFGDSSDNEQFIVVLVKSIAKLVIICVVMLVLSIFI